MEQDKYMTNLGACIVARAITMPDETAFTITNGEEISYGALEKHSARFANALSLIGVEKGDRVIVQADKSVSIIYLYLACLRLGAVYLPLNSAYTYKEFNFFIEDAKPKLIVCASEAEADMIAFGKARNIRVFALDQVGAGSLSERAKEASSELPIAETKPDDLAAIVYTSGTTGRSKGAMLTHENLISNAQALIKAWAITPDDVLVHALPVFHVHGLFVALNTLLLAGGKIILQPRFEAKKVLTVLKDATMMMGVPTYYVRLLAEAGLTKDLCANMRLFVSGSAPLLPEVFKLFHKRTGHEILERYGMTETGMNTSNPLEGPRIPGTVGPALPGVGLRITGKDGAEIENDKPGMLEVSGPNVFKGYWRLPEKTKEEFRDDGFFITGDIATIDDQNYVTIVGRDKDMIISGGLNIYPKEIEKIIDNLDGVGESAVIGVPHSDFGEAVVAVIAGKKNLSEKQILSHVKGELAGYKIPKRIFIIDELPRNAMGKVQKKALRDQHKSLFV